MHYFVIFVYFDSDRFAAALHDLQIDCWVMNVVPVSGFNTLPVIYDRGLIGVMHDWYRQCALNSSFYILLPTSYMLGDFVAYIQILFSLIHKIFEVTILDHESYGHIKCIP